MYFYDFTSVFLEVSNSSVLVVSHKSCVAAFIGTEIVGLRVCMLSWGKGNNRTQRRGSFVLTYEALCTCNFFGMRMKHMNNGCRELKIGQQLS